MAKVVYAAEWREPFWRAVSPLGFFRNLWTHRELTLTYARREFEAAHRNTFLGAAWAMLTPLIMLALFAFVFGYIFKGRFNLSVEESPVDFALALFVGLSIYNCFGAALTASPGLMYANATYVKTLSFPIEIISVAQTYNLLKTLLISLGLCLAAFLITKGYLHWTTFFVALHVVVIAMLVLGISWFLSAVAVFVPDTSAVTAPLSMILMFLSGVFFPIESMPGTLRLLFQLNPIAVIIQQARGALLYGAVPNLSVLLVIAVASFVIMLLGYYVFRRSKAAFSDVM